MTPESTSSIASRTFGHLPDGAEVLEVSLTNQLGMTLKVINYGAIITECCVPDKKGNVDNVVLSFNNLEQYLAKHPRFGSTIGRYANRISNAQFELEGKTYTLAATKGPTCAHGGVVGFDKKIWTLERTEEDDLTASATMSYLSPNMEEGFPGNLAVNITFSVFKDQNSFAIRYWAKTDHSTPINLTNHSYFNLGGAGNGNILDHVAGFNATTYTPLNADMVPTGEIAAVKDTAYDFHTARRRIGDRINEIGGYDINYIIDLPPADIEGLGSVRDYASGRVLTVFTDQPAFQFFTANSLDGSIAGNGGSYAQYAGFCLETQCYPNSVNQSNFPNTILRPGQTYGQYTQFAFTNLSGNS